MGARLRPVGRVVWPPWRLVRWGLGLGVIGLGALLGFAAWVEARTAPLIYAPTAATLPAHHVALVFGAGLNGAGGPSAVLYDRVATGVALDRAGKVAKLLMTGDNSQVDYNEVGVMRQTALDLGVPATDIVLDYAGFRTYDSCYRARDVFGLRAATLVTNRFHLPRALYTCQALGLDVVGVDADRRPYAGTAYWTVREVLALPVAAWWSATDRAPTFLGPAVDVDHPPAQP
jgi:vancomycin permeability regulator SanA